MAKVEVPAEVLKGLESVRESGLTNMFDRPKVIEIAEFCGFTETAEWVRANKTLYAQGIIGGFSTDDAPE